MQFISVIQYIPFAENNFVLTFNLLQSFFCCCILHNSNILFINIVVVQTFWSINTPRSQNMEPNLGNNYTVTYNLISIDILILGEDWKKFKISNVNSVIMTIP